MNQPEKYDQSKMPSGLRFPKAEWLPTTEVVKGLFVVENAYEAEADDLATQGSFFRAFYCRIGGFIASGWESLQSVTADIASAHFGCYYCVSLGHFSSPLASNPAASFFYATTIDKTYSAAGLWLPRFCLQQSRGFLA